MNKAKATILVRLKLNGNPLFELSHNPTSILYLSVRSYNSGCYDRRAGVNLTIDYLELLLC